MDGVIMAVCPKDLGKREAEMDIAAARELHGDLLKNLMTGPGSSERALHEAAEKYGLSYWCQRNLRDKWRASRRFIDQLKLARLSLLEQQVADGLAQLQLEKSAIGANDDAGMGSLVLEGEVLLAKIRKEKMVLAGAKE
jgi:hypothetical protein